MPQSPSLDFRDSLGEVHQLLAMHAALTGTGPGRRRNVEILHKSAIIFACAAFEAFIENLASCSFDHLVVSASDPNALPKIVRKSIAEDLKSDKHELRIWDLAGDGWKTVAAGHKSSLIRRYIGPFNTPKPQNIAELLHKLLGVDDITHCWKWQGMSVNKATQKLTEFVTLRGTLAHGEKPESPIRKKDVIEYVDFLAPLSVKMANRVRVHCADITGDHPWESVVVGAVA